MRAICKPFEENKQNVRENKRYGNVDISYLGTKVTNVKFWRISQSHFESPRK